jgi:hypothetical protein
MKRIVLLIPVIFLVACTGSGMDRGLLLQQTNTEGTQIFVKRDTGYAGVAALVRVNLDGISIGELGNGETISADVKGSSGVITANFTGIAGIASSSGTRMFDVNKGEKLFFVIKQDVGLMSTKISIYPTDKNDFFSN